MRCWTRSRTNITARCAKRRSGTSPRSLRPSPITPAKAPHLQEIVGALWLRSIAVGNLAGAEPAALQVDVTRDKAVDDNAFQVELATIVENSFNIHQDGPRLVFREEENPQAKLMAWHGMTSFSPMAPTLRSSPRRSAMSSAAPKRSPRHSVSLRCRVPG